MAAALSALVVALTYPPVLSLILLGVAGMASLLQRGRLALSLATLAIAWSGVWSVPQCSDWLRQSLEDRHAAVAERALPTADAIVVLGGGEKYAWMERHGIRPEQLRSSRIAAGARAWLAHRAPTVILSGGGIPGQTEAQRMARAIGRLGVPASALLLEQHSRDTEGNALHTAQLATRHGIRRVLLVTSSVHMPRASLMFRQVGLRVVEVPVPEQAPRRNWRERWIPSRSALWRSGRALKEYAGLAAVHLRPLRCEDPVKAASRRSMFRSGFSRG